MRIAFLSSLLLCFVFACGPGKNSNDKSQVLNDGSTVYGDRDGGGTGTSSGDEQISADPTDYTIYDDSGSISSSELDISDVTSANLEELNWDPIYFDFDQSSVTELARNKLRQYAAFLKSRSEIQVLLEGHCDHRGTEDYNLALGERRAQAVKRYLMEMGVPSSQMRTISYGELRPESPEGNEAAWALNRRVSFAFR